jgi:hypothetical protein
MNSHKFDEEELTSSLQSLAREMASLNAPPEVEQKLRAAFRARAAVARRSYVNYWVAGIAAVLLIAISVIAINWDSDPRQQLNADVPKAPQIKEEKEEPRAEALPKEPEVVLAEKPRRRPVRRAQRSEVANHVTREIATDFMPLGYLNPASLQDGGQIVRVELPRSALVNFGLPVNMDRYHEKVKADVLLGVDGLAHAIRFVQ